MREPLVHFLFLGAAIFVLFTVTGNRSEPQDGKIVVSPGKIEQLFTGFSRTWQRPPTSEELNGLIEDHVREEVLYREALAMGLDEDDTIVRRRLRQKMEFVTDDLAAQVEPTDEELSAYLNANPEAFRVERRFTFTQVYLNPDRHSQHLARDAELLLAKLNEAGGKADVSALGDPFLLSHKFEAVPGSEIAKQFGAAFAAKLGELSPGHWQGPVESGYGVHLVFVGQRTGERVPALEEVREAVRREWANAERLEANEKLYQGLRKRYTVTIERSQPIDKLAAQSGR